MTPAEFFEKATRKLKYQRNRRSPMHDEISAKLGAEPTYEEIQQTKELWEIFEKLGAKFPPPKTPGPVVRFESFEDPTTGEPLIRSLPPKDDEED